MPTTYVEFLEAILPDDYFYTTGAYVQDGKVYITISVSNGMAVIKEVTEQKDGWDFLCRKVILGLIFMGTQWAEEATKKLKA